MNVRVKLLTPTAMVPSRRDGDAGYDLHADRDATLYPGQSERMGSGIAIELPPDYCALVMGRSGHSINGYTVRLGLIDGSYRGNVSMMLSNQSVDGAWRIKRGDRVAQMVIMPVAHCDLVVHAGELSPTDRGTDGFGSTGHQ